MGKISAAERREYTAPPAPPSDEVDGVLCTAPVHQAPPEARDLSWDDAFFDGDSEVIAVFDFDYATMEGFYTSTSWAYLFTTLIYPPIFVLACFGLVPCFLKQNVRWNVRSQHVAITRDGIRFVRDRRKTCWGCPCTDAGRSSKTVPFDKITDCDIEEPAGATCCCITNVLATVNIDTASSGGPQGGPELKISGLRDPHSFKKLVWAMKRLYAHQIAASGSAAAAPAPVSASIIRDGGGTADGGEDAASVALLLREIRDELRELRKAGGQGVAVAPAVASAVSDIEMQGGADFSGKKSEEDGPTLV